MKMNRTVYARGVLREGMCIWVASGRRSGNISVGRRRGRGELMSRRRCVAATCVCMSGPAKGGR